MVWVLCGCISRVIIAECEGSDTIVHQEKESGEGYLLFIEMLSVSLTFLI